MGLTIGIPKERYEDEHRVGMTPAGVAVLTDHGHQVYVEAGAGVGSGFSDVEYEQAGARLTYTHDEPFRRADLLLKVQRPTNSEVGWMRDGQIVMAFMMMAVMHETRRQALKDLKASAIAYELVQEDNGQQPVMLPLSQIGGRLCAQIAQQFLQNNHGGNGVLLGGTAGVPPADVVIIGAGRVGCSAADAFKRQGARVIMMDNDQNTLQRAMHIHRGAITTMVAHDFNLRRVCQFADVLVGAIQVPGRRTPQIITREMVRSMRPGSLIIDMSIDQGGCVETSRPTNHADPTFVAENVTHYCVRNVPGVVGRTATHAFVNAAWPYIMQVANEGLDTALKTSRPLRRGLVLREGELWVAVNQTGRLS